MRNTAMSLMNDSGWWCGVVWYSVVEGSSVCRVMYEEQDTDLMRSSLT